MSAAASPRLSLILPIGSRGALLAASQVVLWVLRLMRVELDLLRAPDAPGAPSRSTPGLPGTILFVAANPPWTVAESTISSEFEQALRAGIERDYARRGLSPVAYVLEIL
jgi:hypothetical protein